jgi:hypothetical protein
MQNRRKRMTNFIRYTPQLQASEGEEIMASSYTRLLPLVFGLGWALVGCPYGLNPGQDVKSYLEVKSDYIKALEENSDWGGNYRLAFIPPLAEPYPPGTPLLKGSYEPLTNACLVAGNRLLPVALADPPVSASKRTFMLNTGLPQMLAEAISIIAEVNAAVGASRDALFTYSELSLVNPRSDTLRSASRNVDCLAEIANKDILLIRGLISGREGVSSTTSFGAGAQVRLIQHDTIAVRYDAGGRYEVQDATPKPKFWIVSEWRVDIPGLSSDLSRAERTKRIEDFLRLEHGGATLAVQESAPSSATLRQLQEKMGSSG